MLRGQRAKPERVEADEACRVLLVIGAAVILEGDERVAVERLRALAAGDDDVALVELQAHRALDVLLAPVDGRLQHLTLRAEPEAVVDELGVFRDEAVLQVCRLAVERDRLDGAVRGEQDGAAVTEGVAQRLLVEVHAPLEGGLHRAEEAGHAALRVVRLEKAAAQHRREGERDEARH